MHRLSSTRGRAAWLSRAAFITLVSVGCGEQPEEFGVVPVSGRITLDADPLVGAKLRFTPKAGPDSVLAGPYSYAETDADGRYSLVIARTGEAGAVSGEHTVSFEGELPPGVDADDGDVEYIYPVPDQYLSGIDFSVPGGGTDEANFDLVSN
ncbi:MAG: hypothetical protein AAF532_00550 [Planctomycetota bacterium]